ncbi:hypothetical protein K2173_009389 [Erythroxylum novogranatense]|uniref:Uncharacterized protein n=1 Tax=Erythroxylum novogranatense TaxID=1862640 RepID=A0AAV8U7Y8_9ROSI|nr:hypothetical protein K2173_009389 [Erythroxylum novogranatense]
MVLWEITVATAYFLGLKRTYRLASKIQRKIASPKHPKITQFIRRRTRAVFDAALQVHHNIQQRHILGRNVGDLILRWLDSMKPSANIRRTSLTALKNARSNMKMTKWDSVSSHLKSSGSMQAYGLQESKRHLFTSSKNVWAMSLPTITLTRPFRPAGSVIQYRHLSFWDPGMLRPDYGYGGLSGSDGVIRKDIMQYLLQN